MIVALFRFLAGTGAIGKTIDAIREVQLERLKAETDEKRLALDAQLAQLSAALDIARIEAARPWSATSLGRWLIAVPYGLWWAAVCVVSTLGVGDRYVVQDLPPRIHEMAMVLIPAIIVADAGALVSRIWRRG